MICTKGCEIQLIIKRSIVTLAVDFAMLIVIIKTVGTFALFNHFPNKSCFFVCVCLQDKSFENTLGKAEIAHNEQFLFFPVFSTLLGNSGIFIKFKIVSCKLFPFETI